MGVGEMEAWKLGRTGGRVQGHDVGAQHSCSEGEEGGIKMRKVNLMQSVSSTLSRLVN